MTTVNVIHQMFAINSNNLAIKDTPPLLRMHMKANEAKSDVRMINQFANNDNAIQCNQPVKNLKTTPETTS
jgi:hypothetical protein